MIVKINLDKEMSDWLQSISSAECRSNAGQVLYFLKRIKEGQSCTTSTNIVSNVTQGDADWNNEEQNGTDCINKKQSVTYVEQDNIDKEPEMSEEEQDNLAAMLDFQ